MEKETSRKLFGILAIFYKTMKLCFFYITHTNLIYYTDQQP